MQSSANVPDDARKHKADRTTDQSVAVRAVTIDRPRNEVYAFFRRFSNLAGVMEHIERIDEIDERRSHWVVSGPTGSLEWDSVVTDDEPGHRIAWETAEGADVKNHGVVEFRDAPPGRGCEVHASIIYDAPGGAIGKTIAALFQKEPGMQAKRDLRRLKMFLETGEIATTAYPDAGPRYKKADASAQDRAAETR